MNHPNDNRPIQPVCFCIHKNATTSMEISEHTSATYLSVISEGLRSFSANCLACETYVPDVAILLFAGNSHALRDFSILRSVGEIPELSTDYDPDHCLYEVVYKALDMIEARVAEHQKAGRNCMRPILVVVSAGMELDGAKLSSERIRSKLRTGALDAKVYGVSSKVDLDLLKSVFPGETVAFLKPEQICEALKNVWPDSQQAQPYLRNPTPEPVIVPPTPRTPATNNAEEYILGIFTDVE